MSNLNTPGEDAGNLDLARFDEDFRDAPVEDRTEAVPDGKYQASVEKVEITTAKSSGNPMLKWTLRILGPSHANRLLWRNNMMATRENILWLKGDLHLCGLDLQKLSDLPGNLERLLDVKLEVTKRTKGDNSNVYFNRRLAQDEAQAPHGGGDVRSATNDDMPF
jgi:hypothetical protein